MVRVIDNINQLCYLKKKKKIERKCRLYLLHKQKKTNRYSLTDRWTVRWIGGWTTETKTQQ